MSTRFTLRYTESPDDQPEPSSTLFTLRTVVILLVALLAALVVGGLTYLAGNNAATAVLAGLGAFGVVLVGAHKLIQ